MQLCWATKLRDKVARLCCVSDMDLTAELRRVQTGTEVDDKVEQEERVWDAVEGDPVSTEVVVEEGDDDRKNDEVGNQQVQHEQVPVESESEHTVFNKDYPFDVHCCHMGIGYSYKASCARPS